MVTQGKVFASGTHTLSDTFTQLTAVGLTSAIKIEGMRSHTFQIVVAAINTNVIVEAQGSVDGTSFFPLTLDNTATASYAITTNRATITANGNYSMVIKNNALTHVKFNFVSESGGSAATIDVKYYGQS